MNGIKIVSCLPYFCRGEVIKGFGRGSKQLGIPTANFPESVVDKLPADLPPGVYFGWGQVEKGPVHKMVMSIGWNPYYQNTKKSIETHLMHNFDEDFYGSELGVAIVGYIRQETSFTSLEELIKAIHSDIDIAKHELENTYAQTIKNHEFFTRPSTSMNGEHSNL